MKAWKAFLKKKRESVKAERKFADTINSLYKNEESEDIQKWISDWKQSIIVVTDSQLELLVHRVENLIISSMSAYPADIKELKSTIKSLGKQASKQDTALTKL